MKGENGLGCEKCLDAFVGLEKCFSFRCGFVEFLAAAFFSLDFS